jgi:hypothetical protein
MLELQGACHPVDRVEHERHVERLGQRVVLDPGCTRMLDVVCRHGVWVTRERVDEGRSRGRSLAEPSLAQASQDVATQLLGGDLAMRPDAELAAVRLRATVANNSRSPTDQADGARNSECAKPRNGLPKSSGRRNAALPTSSSSDPNPRVSRTSTRWPRRGATS